MLTVLISHETQDNAGLWQCLTHNSEQGPELRDAQCWYGCSPKDRNHWAGEAASERLAVTMWGMREGEQRPFCSPCLKWGFHLGPEGTIKDFYTVTLGLSFEKWFVNESQGFFPPQVHIHRLSRMTTKQNWKVQRYSISNTTVLGEIQLFIATIRWFWVFGVFLYLSFIDWDTHLEQTEESLS